jgi:[ribosomal protein S5]-alanine N-acetyltransferase
MQPSDCDGWPAAVPELTTPRLGLRALQADDAAALLEVLGDQQVTRYHSMPTLTSLDEARDALARVAERFQAGEMIRWAIQPRTQRRLIGTIGLLHLVAEHHRGELGYELARRWWGQGLMPEAAAAVVDYGFTALRLHRIEAGVLVGNDASVRVLEKLGFREEGTLRHYLYLKGRFYDVRWFGLLHPDATPAPRQHPKL